ncbi:MAG TPA: type III PLP-dependent enzyme [Actinoplanes sp.]|nr:type III PLP-dependent enzyme [Actinoplanes sp.]
MPDLVTLTRRYGSPLYVYDLDRVERAATDLHAALPSGSVVYYSLKANPHVVVAGKMRESGCRAEVSSSGELAAALAAGFPAEDCLYTGPGKTAAELDNAIAVGVRRFSAESAGDLARIGRAALGHDTEATVLLRVSGPGSGATGLRMTGAETQFGVDEKQVIADPGRFTTAPGARVVGLHLFPVSNARDEGALIAAFQASIALAARLRDKAGFPLEVVDLGGGFAAPYARPGRRETYPGLSGALRAALDDELPGWSDGDLEVAFESGRYLVGDCGRLVTRVQDVKAVGDTTFAVLDAGINHLGGMAGLGRLGRPAATPEPVHGPITTVTLAGPLCTPADVIGRNVEAPDPAPGDLIVVPNAGAYGLTASLVAFLGRPAPAEIVLAGGDVVQASRLQMTYQAVSPLEVS